MRDEIKIEILKDLFKDICLAYTSFGLTGISPEGVHLNTETFKSLFGNCKIHEESRGENDPYPFEYSYVLNDIKFYCIDKKTTF